MTYLIMHNLLKIDINLITTLDSIGKRNITYLGMHKLLERNIDLVMTSLVENVCHLRYRRQEKYNLPGDEQCHLRLRSQSNILKQATSHR